MDEYNIGEAFQAIENELISSMIRNMDRHRAEETKEGINWTMWQAEQLKELESYKRANKKKYKKKFASLNAQMTAIIKEAKKKGNFEQEIEILKAIQRGYKYHFIPQPVLDLLTEIEGKSFKQKISKLIQMLQGNGAPNLEGAFFRLNESKLNALLKATTNDMQRAETAILRMANDQYRKAIFNAQVYANTGAGTYEKAVDMATKSMLVAGLNCVEYKNGARHTLSDYADMAIRTASKRAYLQGAGEKRKEWGISTVIVNKRGNPCPLCLPFVGKVMIDDVWSGGKSDDGLYPLMSSAIKAGLYHPRCKDSHTTYFEGITRTDSKWTKAEIAEVEKFNKDEAKQQYASRQAKKFERLATHSLDADNKKMYKAKEVEWKGALDIPEISLIHEVERIFTKDEIEKMALEMNGIVGNHVNVKSKWSGKIELKSDTIEYGKLWNCDIAMHERTSPHILLHELLHARSISYFNRETYVRFANIEEGTVQLMTREICKKESIELLTSGYDDFVTRLEEIGEKIKFDSTYDFAKKLIEIPVVDRLDWLEEKLYGMLPDDATIAEHQAVSEMLDMLY